MAVTVTTDLVNRHTMDSTTGVVADGSGVGETGQTSTTFKVQGTASVIGQYKAAAVVGWMSGEFTAADISKLHIFGWINNLDNVDTLANGGWRMRIAASNSVMGSAYGEWTVAGQETVSRPISGFARFCVDSNRPFSFSAGTPVALSAVGAIAISNLGVTASGQNTWFMDSVDTATGITVGGGGVGTEGKSSEIASNDRTNGRGLFKNVSGGYYILGRVTIGSTTAASQFLDSNEVWVFEDQPVSATFHKINFVGWSGGTNKANFGTKSGSGVTTEAAGGNTFKSTGLAPFRVEATDANITVGLYGCSFVNSIAIRDDAPRAVQYATAADAFTNQTRQAGNNTVNDFLFMPATEAVNDKWVIGHEEPFSQIKINVGTAGVSATGSITWEYWNGSTWAALTDVTDGTNSFKTAGTNLVTYAIPDDWTTTTLGGLGPYYYIRGQRAGYHGGLFHESTRYTGILCHGGTGPIGGGTRSDGCDNASN